MLTNNQLFKSFPWGKKASILLLAAEVANNSIKAEARTYVVCKKAIDLCWQWISESDVEPSALAFYLDASDQENPYMSETVFADSEPNKQALIFITMVVGYCANRAYKRSGRSAEMSETICEAGDSIEDALLDWGCSYGINSLMDMLS